MATTRHSCTDNAHLTRFGDARARASAAPARCAESRVGAQQCIAQGGVHQLGFALGPRARRAGRHNRDCARNKHFTDSKKPEKCSQLGLLHKAIHTAPSPLRAGKMRAACAVLGPFGTHCDASGTSPCAMREKKRRGRIAHRCEVDTRRSVQPRAARAPADLFLLRERPDKGMPTIE